MQADPDDFPTTHEHEWCMLCELFEHTCVHDLGGDTAACIKYVAQRFRSSSVESRLAFASRRDTCRATRDGDENRGTARPGTRTPHGTVHRPRNPDAHLHCTLTPVPTASRAVGSRLGESETESRELIE